MKISEAFECGLIPKEYDDVFPIYCKCGSEIEVSDNLTRMWCPNEKCDSKQIARMSKMLTKFEVKDIGDSYCADLWEEMKRFGLAQSHMNVFLLPFSEYPQTYTIDVTLKKFKSIQAVVKDSIFNGGYTLSHIVSNMALPGLDINARKLFAGFRSVKEMQVYCRNTYGSDGLLKFVQSKFGSGVACVNVLHTLAKFGSDIEIAERIFNIKKSTGRTIKVAVTGRISDAGSYTRKEYIKYCNDLCNGDVEIIDTAASSSVMFVIADDYIDSDKYRYGEENNILISSLGFINWLNSEVIGSE